MNSQCFGVERWGCELESCEFDGGMPLGMDLRGVKRSSGGLEELVVAVVSCCVGCVLC